MFGRVKKEETPEELRRAALGDAILKEFSEQTGDLGGMMERIASFYDEELARAAEIFTRTFEPALMVLIGVIIGSIVILMYMPIFELASSLE